MTTRPVPTITDDQLAEIEAAAKAATPGAWVSMNHCDVFTELGAPNRKGVNAERSDGWRVAEATECWVYTEDEHEAELSRDEVKANARHIATANPATVLALVQHIKELEKDAARYAYHRSIGGRSWSSEDGNRAIASQYDVLTDAAMQQESIQ